MKIKISDPVIISRGPTFEEAGWGTHQFPHLYRLQDGRLFYAYAESSDTIDAYGAERGAFVSSDNGVTWERVKEHDYFPLIGIPLENGETVQFIELPSIPVTEEMKFPTPAATKGKTNFYRAEDLDASICNQTWLINRTSKEHPEGIMEPVNLNWPNMLVRVGNGIVVPPQPWGDLRKDPDGNLWVPHYDFGLDPASGEFSPYLNNYLFRSVDGGRNWELMHYLPYDPNASDYHRAAQCEGYNENTIHFAPDGSYVRLIRTNGTGADVRGPSYLVRSTDKGVTWSEPVKFDDIGVWPRLCSLKCGVTLASYGRPGFFVRATKDPSCMEWEDPVELIHVEEGEDPWAATCSYSDLIVLDDHTVGLAHTDFKIKDENGVARKTVLFRTITVEE